MFMGLKEYYIKKDGEKAVSVKMQAYSLVRDIKKMRKKDIKGLRNGREDAELSVYLTEYLTNCRRAVEHAINIAGYLIEENKNL